MRYSFNSFKRGDQVLVDVHDWDVGDSTFEAEVINPTLSATHMKVAVKGRALTVAVERQHVRSNPAALTVGAPRKRDGVRAVLRDLGRVLQRRVAKKVAS
jgi:hypothetical protein